ncbi:hypothetical protein [Endothiovibrio diazotrophicus]
MSLQFSDHPGSHERQLRRRAGNLLFDVARRRVTQGDVDRARALDQQEAQAFLEQFRALVQRAVELKPNEESQVILELKAQLDRAYVECTAMAGEHRSILDALRKLIEVVMQAVRAAAGDDPKARAELDDEERARRAQFELLGHPLVADLMRPDTTIEAQELVPTLLSESREAIRAALWLFEPEQLEEIRERGRDLALGLRNRGDEPGELWEKIRLLESRE